MAAARSLFRASIGAEAMLLPIGAVIFSRVTVAGLILNFAAIPLMTVAQMAGMALVPLSMVWTDGATAAGWVAHVAAEGLVRSSVLLDWAPWLTWRVAAPASWVVGALLRGARLRLEPLEEPALRRDAGSRADAPSVAARDRRHRHRRRRVDRDRTVAVARRRRRRPASCDLHRCRAGRCGVGPLSGRCDAARRRRRPLGQPFLRHRRSRRRAGPASTRGDAAGHAGADPWRRGSHRRRPIAPRRVSSARDLGRDTGPKAGVAAGAAIRRRARQEQPGETSRPEIASWSATSRSSFATPARPTGSVRTCATRTRSSSKLPGAMSRSG